MRRRGSGESGEGDAAFATGSGVGPLGLLRDVGAADTLELEGSAVAQEVGLRVANGVDPSDFVVVCGYGADVSEWMRRGEERARPTSVDSETLLRAQNLEAMLPPRLPLARRVLPDNGEILESKSAVEPVLRLRKTAAPHRRTAMTSPAVRARQRSTATTQPPSNLATTGVDEHIVEEEE